MGFFDAISVIHGATRELAPPVGPILPSSFGVALSALQRIRYVWSLYHHGNIYSNQDNFWHLTSGHMLNVVLGHSRCIQTAAFCVLIASRVSDCVEKQRKLQHSYQKLCFFYMGSYPTVKKISWDSSLHSSSIKEFAQHSFMEMHKNLKNQACEFMRHIYRVSFNLFALSMAIADTADCFSFSPIVRRNAVKFFFLNGSRLIEQTAENTQELLEYLHSHQITIDKMFIGMQSSFRASQIIEALTPIVGAAQTVNSGVQQVQSLSEVSPATIRGRISDFVSAVGLSDFLPESWETNSFERTVIRSFRFYGQYVNDLLLRRLLVISKRQTWRVTRTAEQVFQEISQRNRNLPQYVCST